VGVNPELKDRLDHVSIEMEFMHLLTLKEAYARLYHHGEDKVLLCRQAQEAFLANHLANWVKAFAKRLSRKAANSEVYASVARLLNVYMDGEFKRFGLNSSPLTLSAAPDSPEDYQECEADASPSPQSSPVEGEEARHFQPRCYAQSQQVPSPLVGEG
jgi:hypothetical protein